jgi:predicted MFS family arabinose efflux permease
MIGATDAERSMAEWRCVAAAVYAGVVALLVVNVLPALVNIIGMALKWDDRALGLLASADVAGITLGSLLGIPLVKRHAMRTVIVGGVATLAAADVACAIAHSEVAVVGFRFVGGAASGLILAGCYALYSYVNPQRNFAAFSIGQMVSGFVGVTALPLITGKLGWQSAFYSLAICTAVALPLSLWVPAHSYGRGSAPMSAHHDGHSSVWVWASVVGIVAYVIGEGAVWTFMERMGMSSGISERDVNLAVSACTLAGVLGAVVTMFPSRRLGVLIPLTLSALLSVASVCLMRTASPGLFIAALCGFTFAWLAFATVQFAVIAAADRAGTATIGMSTAWYAGFAIGPYLSGALVVKYGFAPVQVLGVAGVLLALLSLLPLRTPRVTASAMEAPSRLAS